MSTPTNTNTPDKKRRKKSAAQKRREKKLHAARIKQNKERLLQALKQTLGVVSSACEMVNISRETFYVYCKEDPAFKAAVDSTDDIVLDFVENSLHRQIKDGVPASTIFFLKTKGRKRGYEERVPLVFENDIEITIGKKKNGENKD